MLEVFLFDLGQLVIVTGLDLDEMVIGAGEQRGSARRA